MQWEDQYLYLTVNFGSFIFPFIFSFLTFAKFYKEWKYALPAIILTGIVFIIWDEVFTQLGVWGFNPRYLTGIYLGSLPLEEVLFFFCIPYACVFSYFAVKNLITKPVLAKVESKITYALIVILLFLAIAYYDRWYTFITALVLLALLVFHLWWKPKHLHTFYLSYLFVLIPFFLVNGILTGSWIDEPVVWYNNAENMSIRLGTVPADDLFYNMAMLLMSVSLYEFFKTKKTH
ncbi:MAG: lycopene cyclase domain-containing protein [Cyclobacteriaceae bacterium]|jgi:lycopene cyclase domain-containing protein|nr:lycopene cyclase domain-containing protein [Flammeovirgaceae bacterium]MCZ8022389.1 lycopene cyclase domain-containing protein [Cytophagales bacterium]MCZ8327473.1 lycopene cyclase domain-containing protein [Cyclobacteriaceae bacterium]